MRRQAWFDGQPDLDPTKLPFTDETGLSTKMARLLGRTLRGKGCRVAILHRHWSEAVSPLSVRGQGRTTTFSGTLRLTSITAPFVLDRRMNGASLMACVEQLLAPNLQPGAVVITDNQPVAVREAIERIWAPMQLLLPTAPNILRSKTLLPS